MGLKGNSKWLSYCQGMKRLAEEIAPSLVSRYPNNIKEQSERVEKIMQSNIYWNIARLMSQ